MDKDSIISELSRLPLGEDEAAVYVALLSLGTAKVRAIAEESGVHRTSAYRTLEDLADRGLVEVHLTHPKRFTPAPPEHLFERIREEKTRELEAIDEVEDELQPPLATLRAEADEEPGSDGGWKVIRGRDRIREEVSDALAGACDEVLLVCGLGFGSGSEEAPTEGWVSSDEATPDLDARAILDTDVTDPTRRQGLRSSADLDIRPASSSLGADTYLVDGQVFAGLVADVEPQATVVLWTDAPDLYRTQRQMFEGLWDTSRSSMP